MDFPGACSPDPTATAAPPPAAEVGPAAVPPVLPAAPAGPREEPFIFHGRASEYFRIWIVNALLTLLTCGVFLPWAKVRKRRYLRGATELLGHRFDYRADPRRLLIGHAIMAVFFLGYSLFGVVYPPVRWGVILLGVVMLPWIVVRSLAFNAHNTVYRGLRFRFHAALSPAAAVYLVGPVLCVLSLGLYYPAWVRQKRRYVVGQHRLGDAYFRFELRRRPFYTAYLASAGVMVGCVFIGGLITGAMAVGAGGKPPTLPQLIPFLICYLIGFFTARHLVHAMLFNHFWGNTRLDEHRFVARMDFGRWLGLQFTNLFATIGSCGLLYPWAVIRTCRYTAQCLSLVPAGAIDSIRRLEAGPGSATGDSAAEVIGLDFGL
ncbi:YjgN family protein [Opitutus sp. ER46]|uniref:YjgN family protein n=1 Tax=Opitutus sp. ER46 TaxID=2161864 RepID=UPI000D30FE61|nr:YjgN family protein [Opitutus sp. ER46]PTY00685.1 hypothetical protein DB354_01100 [Opitutus sp. ER46]